MMKLREVRAQAGFWFFGIWVCLSSCISSKELVLYQANELGKDQCTALAPRFVPTIKAGDVLSVQVSSLSPEATAFFNPYGDMQAMSGNQ